MIYPKSFSDLVDNFKLLPGIGDKTAERMAFTILSFDVDNVNNFAKVMISAKQNLKPCKICGTLTDESTCNICLDNSRNNNFLMVVEDSKDVFLFEKIGNYDGLYHVLGGLISPIDGVGPDDLSINELVERIKKNNIKEVILSIKSGIEADTTALYIKRILESLGVKVTRLASGIPVGADMDYVDALTLESALNNRKEVLDLN